MKVRIGTYGNERFWVEIKRFLRWRKVSTYNFYVQFSSIALYDENVQFYTDYESARKQAELFVSHFSKRAAVYSRVR